MGVANELVRDGGFLKEAGLEKDGVLEPGCKPPLRLYIGLFVPKMLKIGKVKIIGG